MNQSMRKFMAEEDLAIELVKSTPGIEGITLATELAKASGNTFSQMRSLLTAMLDRKQLWHATAHNPTTGKLMYKYYFDQISRNRAFPNPATWQRRVVTRPPAPKAKSPMPSLTGALTVTPAAPQHEVSPPPSHPPIKPGTPFLYVETHNGPQRFTLEEARRLYEQLHAYFG